MGCLVGIDFGIKRTGLAYTDPNKMIATGLKNLPTNIVISYIQDYFKNEEVDAFIIGKPIQKDGTPSELEKKIKNFILELKKYFPNKKIERYDERYTSKMAKQVMINLGIKKKKRTNKGLVDQISATIILQSYLDRKK
jgi:putative Holliday junction resolvase